MTKRTRRQKPIVGLITLLVIFAVLCLTVLAVLSLQTARYEKTLAEKNAASTAAYYAADSAATDIANELYKARGDSEALAEIVERCGGIIENGIITYTVTVDSARNLKVTIDANDGFAVTGWITSPGGNWQADDGLDLWIPGE